MHILNIIGLILSSYTVAVISSGGQSNVFHAQDGQGNYDVSIIPFFESTKILHFLIRLQLR